MITIKIEQERILEEAKKSKEVKDSLTNLFPMLFPNDIEELFDLDDTQDGEAALDYIIGYMNHDLYTKLNKKYPSDKQKTQAIARIIHSSITNNYF